MCITVICYPLRLYSNKSYNRRIWKYKDQGGWEKYISKNYDMENYFNNINDDRLNELLNVVKNNEENYAEAANIIYLNLDKYLQLNYKKIPSKFKTNTYLFTRLDMDTDSIVKLNFERKAIADMKGIVSEQDALYNSMMWNFARVKFDKKLYDKNKDNLENLSIRYIIAGMERGKEVIDIISRYTC